MRIATVLACVSLVAASAHAQGTSVDAAACARLAGSLKLPNATVTAAQAVAAGQFVPPGNNAALAQAAASCPPSAASC
jgi:hypothetical protein